MVCLKIQFSVQPRPRALASGMGRAVSVVDVDYLEVLVERHLKPV